MIGSRCGPNNPYSTRFGLCMKTEHVVDAALSKQALLRHSKAGDRWKISEQWQRGGGSFSGEREPNEGPTRAPGHFKTAGVSPGALRSLHRRSA